MSVKSYKIALVCTLLFVVGGVAYVYRSDQSNQDSQETSLAIVLPIHLIENNDQAVTYVDQENEPEENIIDQSVVTPEQIALIFPHAFTPLDKKIFYTPQERKDFFNQLGVEYVNEHIIDYAPILDTDAHTSEKYLKDVQENDSLTNLYATDIAMHTLMPLSIRWINEDIGHGIFAEEDLPAGGFVGVYGGIVKDRSLVGSKDYAWSYPGQTLQGGRITLDAAEKGNELRLINDGKDPNCIVAYIIGHDNLWHVCYIAEKDIKKGDQLLISYGPAYWDTRKYKYQELTDL